MNKNWYQESREAAQRIYGADWKLFCGLLAATSPRASVKANLTLATKAYNELKDGGIVRSHFCSAHYGGIIAIVESGTPKGRKCKSFYNNLIGHEDSVTVDRWIARAYRTKNDVPTRLEYDKIEHNIKEQAFYNFNTPAQEQAMLWGSIRGDAGSYANELNQYRLF